MNIRAVIGNNGGPPLDDDTSAPTVYIGEKFLPLYEPYRHKALFGGRGTAKSHTIAECLVITGAKAQEPKRIVCARQFQNSIRESSKELLEHKMTHLRLMGPGGYKRYEREIVHEGNETRFLFTGLERNIESNKSFEGADICWVEEARTIRARALEILVPTILRKIGAEMFWSWNPEQPEDPVDQYFRGKNGAPPNSFVKQVYVEDNPYFWYNTQLGQEMLFMREGNFNRYRHIWLGEYDTAYDSKVFSNVEIGRIEVPEYVAPRYGMDFGFGTDPCAVVKVYIIEELRIIYIAREAFGHVPLRDVPNLIKTVVEDESDYIKADSSQPGTIEHLQSNGFNLDGAKKGPGSVKAGISWIQGYKVLIDPDCEYMRDEARLYSWQVDRLTHKVLNVPVDAHNHGWDAVRYACEDHIMTANVEAKGDPGFIRFRNF